MRGAGPDDATIVGPREGLAGRARQGGALRGVLCAGIAFGALASLGLLAPPESAPARPFALFPGLGPLHLLAAAAGFGLLAALSGIRRLRAGGSAVLSVLEVALGSCPLLLAAGLWAVRLALSAP